MYSTSMEDITTVVYLLLVQFIVAKHIINTYLDVDFVVSMSVAQSTSEYS
jgi:hypothetical protein